MRDHNEKMAIARFREFTVPTLVTRDAELLSGFIDEHGDVILKPLDGMGGASIFRVRGDDPNRNVIIETVAHYGARSVMAQRFIPEIVDGDKRILLIAGEPVPYALARIPKAGRDARQPRGRRPRRGAAAHARATARSPKRWARRSRAEGLLVVGLDVIGDYLTEVNVTSPTVLRRNQPSRPGSTSPARFARGAGSASALR